MTATSTDFTLQMGHLHLCRQRNILHHQYIQTHRPQDSILNQKHHTKPTQTQKPNPRQFLSSGVYKLTCPDCNKAYVGQTGRRFSIRYNKHTRDFYNSQSSSFAQHLLDKAHSFGPINNIMQVLHHQKKRTHLNKVERFYIHKENTQPATVWMMNNQSSPTKSLMPS